MDKVKVYLAWMKKNNFWVLATILLGTAIGCWYMGVGEVQANFNNNKKTIDGTVRDLKAIQVDNPNERFIVGIDAEDKKIREQVFRVTQMSYDIQHKLLAWPEQVKAIGDLKRTRQDDEHQPPYPPGDMRVPVIPVELRDTYQNVVSQPEIKRIIEKVKIRRVKVEKAANNQGGNNRAPVAFTGIVQWDQGNWGQLVDRYRMDEAPSTVRVYVTQEDFWVLETLIDIINYMNRDATDHLNAVVRGIEKLDIAQWATLDAQSDPGAELAQADAGATPDGANPFGNPAMAMPGGAGAGGLDSGLVRLPGARSTTGDEARLTPDDQLIDGRYVDGENKPVSAEAMKTSPPFNEFKQLPIVVRLQMDQRRIPELLAAFANSPEPKALPIEVRQVRMYFTDVDAKVDAMNANNNDQQRERGPYDCDVEVRGIVYLYNPPSIEKLGKGSAPQPARRAFGPPVPTTGAPAAMPAVDPNNPG